MPFVGKKTTLGDHHDLRICMNCRKKQWKFRTNVDWRDGEEPESFAVQPTTDATSGLSGGIPMPPVKPPANQGIGQGFEMPEKRVIVIKASTRCVWLDAEGNVVRESDEEAPTGLTAEEQGRPT
jgi:hypothetical protein